MERGWETLIKSKARESQCTQNEVHFCCYREEKGLKMGKNLIKNSFISSHLFCSERIPAFDNKEHIINVFKK